MEADGIYSSFKYKHRLVHIYKFQYFLFLLNEAAGIYC